jgi:hypothetical protein
MDERKRDSMIAYLRHRMNDFGISPDDLASFPPGVRLVVASELSYQEESEVQVEDETNVFC